MRENEFNNILECNNDYNENYEAIDPMIAACSAEFPEGCIFCEDDL